MLKKFFVFIYISFVICTLLSNKVFATENFTTNNLENICDETGISDILSKYADNEILQKITNVFNDELLEQDDEFSRNEKLKHLLFSPSEFLSFVIESAKSEVKKPLKVILNIIGIILILAIIEALNICFNNCSVNEVFKCVCVLTVFLFICQPLIECVKYGVEEINRISNFMLSIIPIYTGLMSSCGFNVTGGVYNTFLFFICQVFSYILSNKILVIIMIYMAFCLVGSFSSSLNINESAKEIKNIITWTLSFFVTALVGLITVNSVVACSADTVGTKTAKFLISSSVPVIGGAISDAYTSVKGCFSFIKSGTGVFVIIFIALTFLPVLVRLMIWILATRLSAILANFFNITQVSNLLKSNSYVMELLLAIFVSYILIIVVSMTVILVLGLGLF